MKPLLAVMTLALALLATPAFAHDADGKWEGMIDTPMGAIPVGFTFKTDGAALTGSSLGPDGAPIPIKSGKVDGSKKWSAPIVTQVSPAGTFTRAEEYHQRYLEKNPGGYTCHYLRD